MTSPKYTGQGFTEFSVPRARDMELVAALSHGLLLAINNRLEKEDLEFGWNVNLGLGMDTIYAGALRIAFAAASKLAKIEFVYGADGEAGVFVYDHLEPAFGDDQGDWSDDKSLPCFLLRNLGDNFWVQAAANWDVNAGTLERQMGAWASMTLEVYAGEDRVLDVEQLEQKYSPKGGGEHPAYARADWMMDVAGGETIMGYWQAVHHRLNSEESA